MKIPLQISKNKQFVNELIGTRNKVH